MRAEHNVGMLFYEESILHVAGGMIFGKVHRREHMPVVFHFGTISHREAKAREDVDDFILHNRERVTRTQCNGVGRTGQVDVRMIVFLRSQALAEFVQLVLQRSLELIELHTDFTLLFRSHIAKFAHEFVNNTLFAQVLNTEFFEGFGVGGLQSGNLAE